MTDEQIAQIVSKVKQLADSGKDVDDAELVALASHIVGGRESKKVKLKERFRGLHRLERYDSGPYKGMEKCIGCALCAAACPADVITVVAAENDPADARSPGERHAVVYDMDILRCIFCGMCVEACPTEAIVMKHDYELAEDERAGPQGGRNKFLYRQEDLLDREFYW